MDNKKILVIDDEAEFTDFLKEQLELHKYSVETANDGQIGIEKIRQYHPNLIICDFNMPKKDGFGVLRELRGSGDSKTPFFMVSGVDDFERTRKNQDTQASLYITKPFPLSVLLKNIQIFLGLGLTPPTRA